MAREAIRGGVLGVLFVLTFPLFARAAKSDNHSTDQGSDSTKKAGSLKIEVGDKIRIVKDTSVYQALSKNLLTLSAESLFTVLVLKNAASDTATCPNQIVISNEWQKLHPSQKLSSGDPVCEKGDYLIKTRLDDAGRCVCVTRTSLESNLLVAPKVNSVEHAKPSQPKTIELHPAANRKFVDDQGSEKTFGSNYYFYEVMDSKDNNARVKVLNWEKADPELLEGFYITPKDWESLKPKPAASKPKPVAASPSPDEGLSFLKKARMRILNPKKDKLGRNLIQFPLSSKSDNFGMCNSRHYTPNYVEGVVVDNYVHPTTGCLFAKLLHDWKKDECENPNGGCVVAWGDCSHRDNTFHDWHPGDGLSHQNGYCIDIRPMRTGKFDDKRLSFGDKSYDRATTSKFIAMAKKIGANLIDFNDPKIKASRASGHNDHIHLCFTDTPKNRESCENFVPDLNVCPEL
jgi:hypothetical protein